MVVAETEDSTAEGSEDTVVAVDSVTVSSLAAEVEGVTTGTVTPPVPTKVDEAGVVEGSSGVLDRVVVVKGDETSVTVYCETIVDVPAGLSLTCVEFTT